MKPCRICAQPLTGERTQLGYTGCVDCERLHLWGQLASGTIPDWWINPDTWIDPQEKAAQAALYRALKWDRH